MTNLPSRLPAPLSGRLAAASNALFARQGKEVDLAIGGIPFRLATEQEIPQTVETIPIRKDQFDTEKDPGEQSLSAWWRRSQASFHEGAGLKYQEDNDGNASNGFFDSEGIDVFTQGEIRLLKRMEKDPDQTAVSGLGRIRYTYLSDAESFTSTIVGGGALKVGAPGFDYTDLHAPTDETVTDGMIAYPAVYDVTDEGTLYYGTVDESGFTYTAVSNWPMVDSSDTAASVSRMTWGKARLWAIGGNRIWQPDLALDSGSNQEPIFSNPNSGWTYTCMAEGPNAMYFGGHDGMTSTIQAITFDSAGTIPTLSGAAVTATLPDGELVQELVVLAGTLFGIGTNRGFRVGIIDIDTGAIVYGPLIIEPPGVTGCSALGTQGRFFLVAFVTLSERPLVYRVDTSVDLQGGVYAYAKDIECSSGAWVNSIASTTSDTLICTTIDGYSWSQSDTNYVDSGFLQSGRIRYRTTEKKSFKFLALELEPLQGTVVADVILEGGTTQTLGSVTKQNDVFNDQFAINLYPMRYVSLKFTLNSTDDNSGSPVLNSYLLKAMPSLAPQRMITLPLMCYDFERSKSGQEYGGYGFSLDRLTALQILEDAADTVSYQDFSSSDGSGVQVLIDAMKYVQSSPGDPGTKNNGGILQVQLRTVGS